MPSNFSCLSRHFLTALCLIGMGFFSLQVAAQQADSADDAGKPNIVLIYADDLDFDDIGNSIYPTEEFPSRTGAWFTGNLQLWDTKSTAVPVYYELPQMSTPTLDAMAREGVHLTRFYITAPMCTPSRYSLLTGQYAQRAQSLVESTPADEPALVAWNTDLRPDSPSIARQLKKLGYYTAFFGKWHNGQPPEMWPRHLVHEYGDDPAVLARKMEEGHSLARHYICETTGFDYADRVCMSNFDGAGGHNLPWYTEGVHEFLDRNHRQPFFLYMALPVPHAPAMWPHFDHDPLLTPAGPIENRVEVQPLLHEIRNRLNHLDITQRSINTTWIDDAVGSIRAKLEELGIADNTLLIFTSDHQSRGKKTVYEGARVPFLAVWPGKIPAGSTIHDICANIDLLPTLVEIAGGQAPEFTDGISFKESLLTGSDQHPDRTLMLECLYGRALVKGDWKYIANRPPNMEEVVRQMEEDRKLAEAAGERRRVGWEGGTRDEKTKFTGLQFNADMDFPHIFEKDQLYNLEEDVFEQNNLAGDEAHQAKLEELQAELTKISEKMPRPFPLD